MYSLQASLSLVSSHIPGTVLYKAILTIEELYAGTTVVQAYHVGGPCLSLFWNLHDDASWIVARPSVEEAI